VLGVSGGTVDIRERRHRSLAELVNDAVVDDRSVGWSIREHGMWRVVGPADHRFRSQGWKLHLSGTPLSIGDLMDRAVPVLVSERCAFKVPTDRVAINWLNSRACPRGLAGKYVTVYPADDDQFRRLAEELDRATAGLVGPEILSDCRYRPRSVVHYRFGGFISSAALDDDGCYRQMIVSPDGEVVEDRRDAWFAPPAWAPIVLPGQPRRSVGAPRRVLLGDRFIVQKAIRHSNQGGVFRAYDRRTGAPVVVKQARAHVEVDPSGRDCRDRLRHEAGVYARLAPLGLAPRLLDMIDEADHLFLVRELIEGTTLRQWMIRQVDAGGVSPEAGMAMARRVVRLVDAVHQAGLVLVDVSPNNIVVDPAGRPWLIDLDNVAETGQLVRPVGTPGYTPPEHHAGATVVARPEADLFGLGGLLFLLAAGTDPTLAEDDRSGRPTGVRLRGWLAEIESDLPLASGLAAPILGLMSQQPAHRSRVEHVQRYLEHPHGQASTTGDLSMVPDVDRLIADAVAWLREEMNPSGSRLWRSGRFGAETDPCAVQHGAAGVLAVLVDVAPHLDDPEPVREAIELTCRWIEKRLPAEPRLLPGLYFGRSGTAWALHGAATFLGDQQLAARALDLAARLPVGWASPDVAHGVAGAGLAQLHLWRASGDQRFEPRAHACVDQLIAATQRAGTDVSWPIPPTLRSTLAGRTYLGYAHGTAGIGAFLLAAGAATGDARGTRLACEAASTLADATVVRDGAAFWPTRPGGDTLAGAGWCAGSAGIGLFLLRTWQVTGEPRLLELARAAATAVHRARARSNPAACHGLAGDGQFLLDLAVALEEPSYHRWAEDLARLMAVKAVRRGGRLLVPDETGHAVVADFGVGLAGALAFLARLRHGGRSPWTAEPTDARAEGARGSTRRTEMETS
jgi:hypothetical protein